MAILLPNTTSLNSNVPNDLIFSGADFTAAAAARDAFFVSNPTRKLDRLYVILKDNTANSVKYQQYIAASSTWADMSSIVKGDTGVQGVQGNQGVQGPAGVLWRGDFDLAVTYAVNDGVFYNGSSYRCISVSLGNAPTNTTYWTLIAQKGDTGAQGLQGLQGIQGLVGINWTGDYSALSAYSVNDGVLYNGTSYRAIVANTNVLPTDTNKWAVIASKGTNGTNGVDGLTYKGTYNSSTAYVAKDVVVYGGTSYVCILATTGNAPTEAVWWSVLASKGADGEVFDYKGGFDSSVTYAKNAVVTFQGSSYIYTNSTASAGHFPSEGAYWSLVASKGDSGFSGLTFKGVWDTNVTYALNDMVSYNGSSYVATQVGTGHTPSLSSTYWTLFIAQGAQGNQGIQGPAGITWQGTWSNTTTYAISDAVAYNKSSYYALKASTNVQPGTDATTWAVLALKGELSSVEDRFAYDKSTAYNIGDTVSYQGVRYICRVAHTSDATPTWVAANWVPMAIPMVGATATVDGAQGLVIKPEKTFQDAKLLGSGEWDKTGRKTLVTLSNFTANTTLDATTTVDVCEVIAIPQTTAGITVGVPTPTANTKVRKLIFINTGSTSFSLSTGHTVYAGKWIELYWALALQTWETYVGDTKLYNPANAYQAYDRVIIGNMTVYANAAIPAGTSFAWGTSGTTWSPILPAGYVWRGAYNATTPTTYALNDVVVNGYGVMSSLYLVTTSFTSVDLTDWNKGGASVGKLRRLDMGWQNSDVPFIGATDTVQGSWGDVPKPAIGDQDATLKGDGTWDRTGKGVYATKSNLTSDATLGASTTVDVCEFLQLNQTTENINITLPAPTVTTTTRRLSVLNYGTAATTVNTVKIKSGEVASFVWKANGTAWFPQVGGGGDFNATPLNRYTRYMNNGTAKAVTQNVPFTFENAGATVGSNIGYNNGFFSITNSTTITQYYECCFDGFYFNYSSSGYMTLGMFVGTSSSTLGTLNNESAVYLNSSYRTTSIFEDKQGPSKCTISVPAGTTYYVAVATNSASNIQNIWNGRMSIQQIPSATYVPAGSLTATSLSYAKLGGAAAYTPTTGSVMVLPLTQLQGTGIAYNSSTGIVSISKASIYKIKFIPGSETANPIVGKFSLQTSADGSTWTDVGQCWPAAPAAAMTYYSPMNIDWSGSLNAGMQVRLYCVTGNGTQGAVGDVTSYPALYIEETPSATVIPANSLTVSSISTLQVKRTTTQTISANDVPFIFGVQDSVTGSKISCNLTSGLITLTGGSIYDMEAFAGRVDAAGTYFYYAIYDVTAGAYIGTMGGGDTVTSSSATIPTGSAKALVDLSSLSTAVTRTYYVKSAVTTGSVTVGHNTSSYQQCRLQIKEIPAYTATVIAPDSTVVSEWTSYTPVITGTVTTPALPTTNSLKGLYKVVGKSLHLSVSFECAAATGATAGSGVYLIGIPSGFTIDTSKAPVPALMTVSAGNYAGAECLPLGSGIISDRNINHSVVTVLTGSATAVCLFTTNVNRTLWGMGNFTMNSDGKVLKFNAEIPIL